LACGILKPFYERGVDEAMGGTILSVSQPAPPSVDPDVLHQPDISFAAWCLEQYGVNRGVYNTIDLWFYQCGVKHIVSRRRIVIDFLERLQATGRKPRTNRLKLGKGVLAASLKQYADTRLLADAERDRPAARWSGT
jgi:riboflavin kinase